jgi:hypothetical protein
VLAPALERRGSISRTVHVPLESAFLFPTSTDSSVQATAKSMLSYTGAVTAHAVQYISSSFAGTANYFYFLFCLDSAVMMDALTGKRVPLPAMATELENKTHIFWNAP